MVNCGYVLMEFTLRIANNTKTAQGQQIIHFDRYSRHLRGNKSQTKLHFHCMFWLFTISVSEILQNLDPVATKKLLFYSDLFSVSFNCNFTYHCKFTCSLFASNTGLRRTPLWCWDAQRWRLVLFSKLFCYYNVTTLFSQWPKNISRLSKRLWRR